MVRALLTHRYLIAAVFAGLLLQACGVARASEPHYFEPDGIGHNYVVVGGDTLSVSFLPTDESLRHGRLSEHDFEEVAAELGVEVAAIKAVTDIEAGRTHEGFWSEGKPLINFDLGVYRARAARRGVNLKKYARSQSVIFNRPRIRPATGRSRRHSRRASTPP